MSAFLNVVMSRRVALSKVTTAHSYHERSVFNLLYLDPHPSYGPSNCRIRNPFTRSSVSNHVCRLLHQWYGRGPPQRPM